MIKKIRVKKEFTFHELVEDIFNDTDEIYEVEVEQEITEDMEFEQVAINTLSHLHMRFNYSIKRANDTFYGVQEIFARIDGKLQKIWECE